jgi:indolepyruvate ferredoxin oxidoreductase
MLSAFRMLAKFKRLRGTPLDPFGYFAERRMERQLITEYRELIEGLVDQLETGNLDAGIAVAAAAGNIAGYGPVKEQSVEQYRQQLPGLLEAMASRPQNEPEQLAVQQL